MSQCSRVLFNTMVSVMLLTPTTLFAQTAYYTPKALITPIHTGKNQLHTSLGIGGGLSSHISYAFTNHLAVFTTGTVHKGTAKRLSISSDRYNIKKDDYAFTGGIGYFSALNSNFINGFETYLGTGYYNIDNYWYYSNRPTVNHRFTQANYKSIFWQINAIKKIDKLELVGSLRFAYSDYNNLLFYEMEYNRYKFENFWGLTADPVLNVGYTWNKYKFNMQTGLSLPLKYVEVKEYEIDNSQKATLITNSYGKVGLGTFLGRLSIERNFDLKRNLRNH